MGEGGSRGGGAHREGVGEQLMTHRQPPHPLLAPTPRSSFKHSIQLDCKSLFCILAIPGITSTDLYLFRCDSIS